VPSLALAQVPFVLAEAEDTAAEARALCVGNGNGAAQDPDAGAASAGGHARSGSELGGGADAAADAARALRAQCISRLAGAPAAAFGDAARAAGSPHGARLSVPAVIEVLGHRCAEAGTRHAALGGAAADVEALSRVAGAPAPAGASPPPSPGPDAPLPGCDAAQSARVRALAGRALGLAVELGRGDVVRALVSRAGAPVSPGALEAALRGRHADCVEALVAGGGARLVNALVDEGKKDGDGNGGGGKPPTRVPRSESSLANMRTAGGGGRGGRGGRRNRGDTLLHLAASQGNAAHVRTLLARFRRQTFRRNPESPFPLFQQPKKADPSPASQLS